MRFRELAVAVVDEQHRFGVRQRAALEEPAIRQPPHMLHMTATPIPRTLALARHGDLDRSVLRELPHGRQPIDTRIVAGEDGRAEAYRLLREQLDAGRQGMWSARWSRRPRSGAQGEQAGASRTGSAESRRGPQAAASWARRARRSQSSSACAMESLPDVAWSCCTADAPAREAAGDGGVRLRARRTCWSRRP